MNIFKLVGSVSMKGTSDVEGQLDTIDKKGKKRVLLFCVFRQVCSICW